MTCAERCLNKQELKQQYGEINRCGEPQDHQRQCQSLHRIADHWLREKLDLSRNTFCASDVSQIGEVGVNAEQLHADGLAGSQAVEDQHVSAIWEDVFFVMAERPEIDAHRFPVENHFDTRSRLPPGVGDYVLSRSHSLCRGHLIAFIVAHWLIDEKSELVRM